MNTTTTKMIAQKVQGECGFCGAVKIVPAHRSDQVRPAPVRSCEHG